MANPTETVTRVDCPKCHRMAGQLARKVQGRYVGYQRRDGGRIYSCSFCGTEFEVQGSGPAVARDAPEQDSVDVTLKIVCSECGKSTGKRIQATGKGKRGSVSVLVCSQECADAWLGDGGR